MDDLEDVAGAFRVIELADDIERIAGLVLAMPEHRLLLEHEVRFGYLVRAVPKESKGKVELGSVHDVKHMAQGGFKDLFFQLLGGMLGYLPTYLVVLDATYWAQADETQRTALLFHEFKHVQQKVDTYGAPRYDKDGLPCFGIMEHDVTAFHDEVRRFGAWNDGIRNFLAAAIEKGEESHGF